MSLKNKRQLITLCLLALLALGLGLFVYNWYAAKTVDRSQFHGTWLETPRAISTFELMGTDNVPFNNQRLKGHWTFLFFGFTNCGSVCPVTMAELSKVHRILMAQGVTPLPQVVMITLDPKRDSLARLDQYVKAFHPHFLGARGSLQAVQAMASEMGIAFARMTPNTKQPRDYSIEHTGAVMLINPNEQLVAFFTPPHQAASIAQDYRLLNTL